MMPDDPAFGLDALVQSLPNDKPVLVPEYDLSAVDFGPFVHHFHAWCEAEERLETLKRMEREEAALREAMQLPESGGRGK